MILQAGQGLGLAGQRWAPLVSRGKLLPRSWAFWAACPVGTQVSLGKQQGMFWWSRVRAIDSLGVGMVAADSMGWPPRPSHAALALAE